LATFFISHHDSSLRDDEMRLPSAQNDKQKQAVILSASDQGCAKDLCARITLSSPYARFFCSQFAPEREGNPMPIFPTITSVLDALKKHITLALFFLSLAASALFIYSWLDARRSAAQLAATLASQQKIIATATAAQSARDAALTQSLAQIAALERQIQTPQQASAALSQSLPKFAVDMTGSQLPAPLQFIPFPTTNSSPNSSTPSNSAQQGTTPTGNSSAQPQEKVVILSGAKDPAAPPTTTTTTTAPSASPSSGASSTASPAPSTPAGFLSILKSEISKIRSLPPGADNLSTPSTPPHAPGELATNHGDSSTQQGTASPGQPAGASAQAGNPAPPVPGSICIPPLDLKPLYDSIEDCEACAAKLTAAQSDLSDETTKFNAASAERDAAVKSAHGTFWSRARTAAKWIAIGAAAGAVLAKYH
jgi:hypothetical protein